MALMDWGTSESTQYVHQEWTRWMRFEKKGEGTAFRNPAEGKAIPCPICSPLSDGKDYLNRYWDGVPKRNCLVR